MPNKNDVHLAFVSVDSALSTVFVDGDFNKPACLGIFQSVNTIAKGLDIAFELYWDWSLTFMGQVMEDAIDLQQTHTGEMGIDVAWLRPKFDSIYTRYKNGDDADDYGEDLLELIEGIVICAPDRLFDTAADFDLFD